jgi:hypothetical protein
MGKSVILDLSREVLCHRAKFGRKRFNGVDRDKEETNQRTNTHSSYIHVYRERGAVYRAFTIPCTLQNGSLVGRVSKYNGRDESQN